MFAAFLTTILFPISGVCGHRATKPIGEVEAIFSRPATATLFLGPWTYGFGKGACGVAFLVFF